MKSPISMPKFDVYGLKERQQVNLPMFHKQHRLSIILFYLKRCVPSITHLNYFAKYASSHREQV